jgi:hypothetical protein
MDEMISKLSASKINNADEVDQEELELTIALTRIQ